MNKEEIVERASQVINLEKVVFLVYYGNLQGQDIDLLAVIESGVEINHYRPSSLDILEINEPSFWERLRLFDPVFTEPILTGSLLFGNEEVFSKARNMIKQSSPSKAAVRFLEQRSLQELGHAEFYLEKYEIEKNNLFLFYALIDLSFALSYLEFSKYYNRIFSKSVITLRELLQKIKPELLQKVLSYLKLVKKSKRISRKSVVSFCLQTKKLIRGDN